MRKKKLHEENARLRAECHELRRELSLMREAGEVSNPGINDIFSVAYRQIYLLNQNSYFSHSEEIRENAQAIGNLIEKMNLIPQSGNHRVDEASKSNSGSNEICNNLGN